MGFDDAETMDNLWMLLPEVDVARASAVPLDRVARICPNRCSADANEIARKALSVARNGGHWPDKPRGKHPARLVHGVDVFNDALAERIALSHGDNR
jgi:hypothetical protein